MKQLAIDAAAPHAFGGGSALGGLAAAFHTGVLKRLRAGLDAHPRAAALWRSSGAAELALAADPGWWQPEVGAVLGHTERHALLEAVIQALLSLHARGIGGRWTAELAHAERFSMGGHCFELDGEVDVAPGPDRVALARAGLRPLVLARSGGGWHLEGGPADPGWRHGAPFHLRPPALAGIYLQRWDGPAAADNAGIVIEWPRHQSSADADGLAGAADAFEQAFALLEQAGPCYLPWIKPLLRGICVTPMVETGQHNSGSNIFHAGVVSCGFPVDAPLLAEAIVHESSHQHFHLLHSIMPLVRKGADEARYYSSLKRAHRPLFLVLLAFHATANMSLLWDDLLRRRQAPRYAAELRTTLAHTRSLARHLHANAQLSELGAILFATQAALLRERGHEICPAPGQLAG
jgi:HEXXH motif-containing protein